MPVGTAIRFIYFVLVIRCPRRNHASFALLDRQSPQRAHFDTASRALYSPSHRKPCLRASSFASAASSPSGGDPIRVAPKPKRRRKSSNVFLDDRGFPDQSDEYDHLLHSIDGGPVLRKLRHPMPDLQGPVDPSFDYPFVPEEHEAIMRQKVDLSHLTTDQQHQVYDLIRDF